MNIVVYGPGMELRDQPPWALQLVPGNHLTPMEILVQRAATEMHDRLPSILGVPWVNPRGRSKLFAHVEDYLTDPQALLVSLVVGFLGQGRHRPDVALIACDAAQEEQLGVARSWIATNLPAVISKEAVVWIVGGADLETYLGVDALNPEALRDAARAVPLRGGNAALTRLCEDCAPIFR